MADDFLTLTDLRGGRSGKDAPFSVPDKHCAEAINVDFYYSKCGNKRWGALAEELPYEAQTSPDKSLFRYVPNSDNEGSAELWTFNGDTLSSGYQVHMLSSGGWTSIPTVDALARTLPADLVGVARCAVLNGKLFICYRSHTGVNRLHVWDGPTASTIRRVGVAAGTNPPTVMLTLGAVTDSRRYRVAWTKQVSGVTTYRSELTPFSTVQVMTTHVATVSHPALPGEGETHWELYSYSDDDNYGTGYLLGTSTVATGAMQDNLPALVGDAPPEIGLNLVPTSWKYIMVHGNRLLGAGSHESGGLTNRVWFTPPLGTLLGDDERIPETLAGKNRVDLDESDGGVITGFGGVINGTPIVFKSNSTHRLQPTGTAAQPYQQVALPISRTIGCIRQETVVNAEDENGAPCVYWLSRQGPYRYGARGLEYCGQDIEDLWKDAGTGQFADAHGIYYPDKKQIWWWIGTSTTTNRVPNLKMVFHVQHGRASGGGVRGGWTQHNGPSAKAWASVMFAKATSSSRPSPTDVTITPDLTPFISQAEGSGGPRLWECDVIEALDDNGTPYQAYVQTPAYAMAGMGNLGEVHEPLLLMRDVQLDVTSQIGMQLLRDFNEEHLTDTVTYEGPNVPRYKLARLGVSMVGAAFIQLLYGDVGQYDESDEWEQWWGVEAVMLKGGKENRQ